MVTYKRAFTLRLHNDVFEKIGELATKNHRSVTNYIELVLLEHIAQQHKPTPQSSKKLYYL